MVRIFVGIKIPEDIKNLLSTLKRKIKGGRWLRKDQLHLTLSYIGEVSEFDLERIKNSLNGILSHPLNLRLNGVGNFSTKALWAGISPSKELSLLKKEIDKRLKSENINLDKRKFIPHITLARIRNGKVEEIADFLECFCRVKSDEFEVNKFVLFSSKLKKDGAEYLIESEFSLKVSLNEES